MDLLQEIDAAAAKPRLDAGSGDIAFTPRLVRGLEASTTAGSEQQSEGASPTPLHSLPRQHQARPLQCLLKSDFGPKALIFFRVVYVVLFG